MEEERRIALLIDGDNISYKYLPTILGELNKIGRIVIKRVYGDFSNDRLNGWKEVALKYSLNPIHSYNFTSGKSSTDSSLIIDCMDILYTNNCDTFCLCSSDSDYVKLMQRLKENGKEILGMGENKTNDAFRSSCDRFYPLNAINEYSKKNSGKKKNKKIATILKNKDSIDNMVLDNNIEDLYKVLVIYVNELTEREDYVHLSQLSTYLYKQRPEFDIRSFGFSKIIDIIKCFKDTFEIKNVPSENDPSKVSVYIRLVK